MKLCELIETLELKVISNGRNMDCEITGGYTSDLLSDVMGNAEEGMVWITLQIHRNIIAVASLKDVAAVLLINGGEPDDDSRLHAQKQGVTILSTPLSAFEASGRIYELINK